VDSNFQFRPEIIDDPFWINAAALVFALPTCSLPGQVISGLLSGPALSTSGLVARPPRHRAPVRGGPGVTAHSSGIPALRSPA